tara:strand:- start:5862 stop:6791 length:930 start_codon:yes stop_codon:yes gene_type:complete
MKIYIQKSTIQGAWLWINKGYKSAWENEGFDVVEYTTLEEINDTKGTYDIISYDWLTKTQKAVDVLKNSNRAYFFSQPNNFPLPWGSHPNFKSVVSDEHTNQINESDNIYLWTFGEVDEQKRKEYWTKWKDINTVPLAFDSINYKNLQNEKYQYDVCFIGGWANNGFDEKRKIMLEYFRPFMKSNLKCGIFIEKNLTHEQENLLLYNSKVSINIHDAHHYCTHFDTNERTFKALGLTGLLVSDAAGEKQMKKLFPEVPLCDSPKKMLDTVEEYVKMPEEELQAIKEKNRKEVRKNHTYINRVKQMMSLK